MHWQGVLLAAVAVSVAVFGAVAVSVAEVGSGVVAVVEAEVGAGVVGVAEAEVEVGAAVRGFAVLGWLGWLWLAG